MVQEKAIFSVFLAFYRHFINVSLTVNNAGSSGFSRLNSEELSKWIEDYSVGELW